MKDTTTRKRVRNDLLLVGVIAVVALIAFGIFALTMEQGESVTVSVDGVEKHTYSLSEDIETVITTGPQGEQTNRLVIKEGKAYVDSANCPDKICAAHRPISKDGETIVCLPHRVVIEVTRTE